jgi:signal transduction histidine kinase
VRAAVGLLRTTDARAVRPAPKATDVAELVESYRKAGAGIDLDVQGDLADLTPNRSLAAFRIVQEALTNAVRHGDGNPISVRIVVLGDNARIIVRNGGHGPVPRRTGNGISAMCERARALGGHLTAGPEQDDWLVEAVIPT